MTRSAVRLMCYCVCVFFCVLVEQPPPPPPHTCACALAVCGGLAVCELGLPSPTKLGTHLCVTKLSAQQRQGNPLSRYLLKSPHTTQHTKYTRVCVARRGMLLCCMHILLRMCVDKAAGAGPPSTGLVLHTHCTHAPLPDGHSAAISSDSTCSASAYNISLGT